MSYDTKMKIVVLAGSARTGSVNQKLATAAANILREQGVDVSQIDLNDYPAPVYNGDIEAHQKFPESLSSLKRIIADASAVGCAHVIGGAKPCRVLSIDPYPATTNPKYDQTNRTESQRNSQHG